MLRFDQVDLNHFPWEETHAAFTDRTIFQSPAWMNFLKATQKGEPVVAALRDRGGIVGYFTGMIIRKFRLKILGSPFPGWSTSYMGLNMQPGVCKRLAVDALKRFAFGDLSCAHLEFLDRKLSPEDIVERGFQYTSLNSFEVDLSLNEERIFGSFHPGCRQAIRKAIRSGVVIEEADDAGFIEEYYAQLRDVFAKQGLVPTYDIDRVRELIRHIGPTGNLFLLRARNPEGRCIATSIFVRLSPTVFHFWGGASRRCSQILRPNDLLMWTAMRLGKARGIQALDMGGAGEYKRKFGGRPISVPWVRVSSQPFVPLLRDMAKRLFKVKQRLQAKGEWRRPVETTAARDHSDIRPQHVGKD